MLRFGAGEPLDQGDESLLERVIASNFCPGASWREDTAGTSPWVPPTIAAKISAPAKPRALMSCMVSSCDWGLVATIAQDR